MLFKRGSTISAAEGGKYSFFWSFSRILKIMLKAVRLKLEVGMICFFEKRLPQLYRSVACSMAAAGFAACMGGKLRSDITAQPNDALFKPRPRLCYRCVAS